MPLSDSLLSVPGAIGGGGTLRQDSFGADTNPLAGIWTARVGTFEALGGIARGKTIAVDGINLVANPEFAADTTGWSGVSGAVLARRDFTAAPDIDPTGGADEFGLEVLHGTAALGYGKADIAFVPGITVTASCRAYSPSTNTAANAAMIFVAAGISVSDPGNVEDAWETLAISGTPTAIGSVRCYCQGTTLNDLAYFDAISVQQQAALVTCDPGQANVSIEVDVTTPGSGIVPFGIVFRYQDATHYWLWRIRPGTAGVDSEIVEVNGATITVRDSEDFDWSASTAYALKVVCHDIELACYVDGVLRLSFTSASFQAETECGLYDAGIANATFDNWTVSSNHVPGLIGLYVSGDSISDGVGEWPALVVATGAQYTLFNHAVNGQNVVDHMLAQVTAASAEAPNHAVFQLSTNDTDLMNFEAAYLAALNQFKVDHPGVAIFCMGTLDRTNMVNVPEKRVMIASAAASAGATYWNTSGWINPATDTDDGLHPNAGGSAKIAVEVLARL